MPKVDHRTGQGFEGVVQLAEAFEPKQQAAKFIFPAKYPLYGIESLFDVLATSLDEELVSFGQLYRDRGDSENIFDELKNQWGWGGFVTQDLARCRLAARLVALFYDWWNIFVRLVEPDRHMEAITSRPLLW